MIANGIIVPWKIAKFYKNFAKFYVLIQVRGPCKDWGQMRPRHCWGLNRGILTLLISGRSAETYSWASLGMREVFLGMSENYSRIDDDREEYSGSPESGTRWYPIRSF